MGYCPNCQHEYKEDFGLIVCDGCGKSLFIDMDGLAQYAENDESQAVSDSVNEALVDSEQVIYEDGGELDPSVEVGYEEPLNDFGYEDDLSSDGNGSYQENSIEDGSLEMSAEYSDDGSVASEEDDLEAYEDEAYTEAEQDSLGSEDLSENDLSSSESEFEDFEEEDGFEKSRPVIEKPKEDMSEIADFGNSDVSSAREGTLVYKLLIQGIDSKELRRDLLDCLDDARFLWDLESVAAKIKNGRLELPSLSAPKAAIIIERIKGLPLELKWEQYGIF